MTIETYLSALETRSEARSEVQSVVQILNLVARQITQKPTRFIFANQPVGLPMEATMMRDSQSVDASQFPTVEKIMRILERLHAAEAAALSEWNTVPQPQRAHVTPPDR